MVMLVYQPYKSFVMQQDAPVKRGRGRPPKKNKGNQAAARAKAEPLHTISKSRLRRWWFDNKNRETTAQRKLKALYNRSKSSDLTVVTGVEPYECSICLELMIHPISLTCGHSFCLRCIEKVESEHNRCCPHCRSDITEPFHELDPSLDRLVRHVYDSFMGEEEREAYDERGEQFRRSMDDRGCQGQAVYVGYEVNIKTLDYWMKGVVTQASQNIIEVRLNSKKKIHVLRKDSYNLKIVSRPDRMPILAEPVDIPMIPFEPPPARRASRRQQREPVEVVPEAEEQNEPDIPIEAFIEDFMEAPHHADEPVEELIEPLEVSPLWIPIDYEEPELWRPEAAAGEMDLL